MRPTARRPVAASTSARRHEQDCRLDWWCTEHPDAFSADEPVYVTMEAELRRVCGAAVYDELAAYCQARQDGEPRSATLLPMIP